MFPLVWCVNTGCGVWKCGKVCPWIWKFTIIPCKLLKQARTRRPPLTRELCAEYFASVGPHCLILVIAILCSSRLQLYPTLLALWLVLRDLNSPTEKQVKRCHYLANYVWSWAPQKMWKNTCSSLAGKKCPKKSHWRTYVDMMQGNFTQDERFTCRMGLDYA